MGKQQSTSGDGSRTKAKSEKKFNQELDVPPQAYQRYSDVELQMFKELIDNKITELTSTIASSKNEDLSELKPWEKESVLQERTRTENQVTALRLALSRIQDKTYGVCTVTGKLIPQQRLRLQLTATKTVEAELLVKRPGFSGPNRPTVASK